MSPLAALVLDRSTLELWPGSVRTVFADGSAVDAEPYAGGDLAVTAVHEALYAVLADVRASRDGAPILSDALSDEALVALLAPLVVMLIETVSAAYRDGLIARGAVLGAQRADVLRVAALRQTLKALRSSALGDALAEIEAALEWDARAARGEYLWAPDEAVS